MFSEEVKREIYEAQNGYCGYEGCTNPCHSCHHKLSDTKFNLKRYPIFLNSVLNGIYLCQYHHTNFAHLFRITEQMAEVYETFLRSLKDSVE